MLALCNALARAEAAVFGAARAVTDELVLQHFGEYTCVLAAARGGATATYNELRFEL